MNVESGGGDDDDDDDDCMSVCPGDAFYSKVKK